MLWAINNDPTQQVEQNHSIPFDDRLEGGVINELMDAIRTENVDKAESILKDNDINVHMILLHEHVVGSNPRTILEMIDFHQWFCDNSPDMHNMAVRNPAMTNQIKG